MLANLLTLDFLGINKSLIYHIYQAFSEEDLSRLLNGDVLDLQFKYNILTPEVTNILLDTDKVKLAKEKVENLIKNCKDMGIEILSYFDTNYPPSLKHIARPPMFLYILGNKKLLSHSKTIACVGTRKPSKYAIEQVDKIVTGLTKENFAIISGLATGIDIQAHKACLYNDGKTIAVMAHGLDTIYPSKHKEIANLIVENGGAIISEYPIATPIKKTNFVVRNRIIAGLSKGVIIFEANEYGGTMHTARFAYKQGRKIFCPVKSGDNPFMSSGVKKLLHSNSAIPVKNHKDIIRAFQNNTTNSKMLRIDDEIYNELQLYASNKNLQIEDVVKEALSDFLNKNKELKP